LRELETVVDVGANEGRWSAAILVLARPKRLVAVEPSPDVLPLLRAAIGSSEVVSIIAAAAGASIGEVRFNVTSHSHAASLLSPRSDAMNTLYGGGYDVARQVSVPQTTIDEIMGDAERVSLLKLDVQGGEREAIEGARKTLARTRWLLVETNFQSHYLGDMLFPELHALLVELGFTLIAMSQPFVRLGVALWSDSLYERA
jgi:FkbM family methyltransferase